MLFNPIMRMTKTGAAALCFLASFSTLVQASALNGLVAHRAIYDVDLIDATDRSGINGMNGLIVYEFVGSPCEGFAVKFRFVTRIKTGRKSYVTDQRTTTFEDIKGGALRFLTRTYVNDQFEKEVRGAATITDAGTKVALVKPESRELELGKSIFMTRHLATVIERAKQGEKFFTADVFDGSDNGDELMATTTIIGARTVGEAPRDATDEVKLLKGQPSWPVSISYFSLQDEHKGESLPVYQVSFDLYENGISGDLKMRYKDYSLKGKLSKLELLPAAKCE